MSGVNFLQQAIKIFLCNGEEYLSWAKVVLLSKKYIRKEVNIGN